MRHISLTVTEHHTGDTDAEDSVQDRKNKSKGNYGNDNSQWATGVNAGVNLWRIFDPNLPCVCTNPLINNGNSTGSNL